MYMCLLIAHGNLKTSHSFPTSNDQPMTTTHRQQSGDNINRRLDYGMSEIAEETPEQPSQVC